VPHDLNTAQDALRHVLVALGDRFEHAVAGAPVARRRYFLVDMAELDAPPS